MWYVNSEIFARVYIRVKIKSSRNGEITLSFTDICKSCLIRDFLTSQICLISIRAKISKFTVCDCAISYSYLLYQNVLHLKLI